MDKEINCDLTNKNIIGKGFSGSVYDLDDGTVVKKIYLHKKMLK